MFKQGLKKCENDFLGISLLALKTGGEWWNAFALTSQKAETLDSPTRTTIAQKLKKFDSNTREWERVRRVTMAPIYDVNEKSRWKTNCKLFECSFLRQHFND